MWVLKSKEGVRISAHPNRSYLEELQEKHLGSSIEFDVSNDFEGETANAGFGLLPKKEKILEDVGDEEVVWPKEL